MEKKAIVFISCGIFQQELEYLVKARGLNWKILYLDAALHVNFDRLKAALTRALAKCRNTGADIRVIYGHCHPEMTDILEQYQAKKINAGNCLEAMVGPEEIRRLNREGKAFFLSAGWVNSWEKMFALGKQDYNFDFKSMFGDYKRIIVFDSGVIPIDEAKVASFSKYADLPVQRRQLTLDYLMDLINGI